MHREGVMKNHISKKAAQIQSNVQDGTSWLHTIQNTAYLGIVALPLYAASIGMFESTAKDAHPTLNTVEQENFTSTKPASGFVAQELDCLARNIYFEARGESFAEQVAVGNVTLNRVASKHYPDTVCEVVYQPYQFSWTLENDAYKTIRDAKAWQKAIVIAAYALTIGADDTNGSTHYYAHDLIAAPFWADSGYDIIKLAGHTYMKLEGGV